MKTKVSVVEAKESDLKEIEYLLSKSHLPIKDISNPEIDFYLVKDENGIKACAGIEKCGNMGLLRSVAVKEELRMVGLGSDLIDQVLLKVKESNMLELYLLTETAEHFFSKKQFISIDREKAPQGIKASSEFSEICPSSAILMKKKL